MVSTISVVELPVVAFGWKLAAVAPGKPVTVKVKLSVKPALREIFML